LSRPKVVQREHLIRNIPNWWIMRRLVFWLNKKMKQSDSIYRLKIRYRKPKDGDYGWGGSVKRSNANAFSIYIRLTRPYERSRYGLYTK